MYIVYTLYLSELDRWAIALSFGVEVNGTLYILQIFTAKLYHSP